MSHVKPHLRLEPEPSGSKCEGQGLQSPHTNDQVTWNASLGRRWLKCVPGCLAVYSAITMTCLGVMPKPERPVIFEHGLEASGTALMEESVASLLCDASQAPHKGLTGRRSLGKQPTWLPFLCTSHAHTHQRPDFAIHFASKHTHTPLRLPSIYTLEGPRYLPSLWYRLQPTARCCRSATNVPAACTRHMRLVSGFCYHT